MKPTKLIIDDTVKHKNAPTKLAKHNTKDCMHQHRSKLIQDQRALDQANY